MAKHSKMMHRIGTFDTGKERLPVMAVAQDPTERVSVPDEVVLASYSFKGNLQETIRSAKKLANRYRKSDRRLAKRISRNVEELEGLARQ